MTGCCSVVLTPENQTKVVCDILLEYKQNLSIMVMLKSTLSTERGACVIEHWLSW